MNQHEPQEHSRDWARGRGERWLRYLTSLEATFSPLSAPLVEALILRSSARVAEIGCGGGGFAVEFLEDAPPGTSIDGFDICPALVEHAEGRDYAGGARFHVKDMGQVCPPSERYDRLVSRLGVMFFQDDLRAFAALRSWLQPGGRFAFAVWGPLENNPWSRDVDDIAARFGILDPPRKAKEEAPLESRPGPERYSNAPLFSELLTRAGFITVESSPWRGNLPVGGGVSSHDAARFVLQAFSSASNALDAAGGDARSRAEWELASRWGRYEVSGQTWIPAAAHIVSGAVAS